MNPTLRKIYIDLLARGEWVMKVESNSPNTYNVYITYLHNPNVVHSYILTPNMALADIRVISTSTGRLTLPV